MFDTLVSLFSASGLQTLPRYGGWKHAVSEQLGAVGEMVSGLGSLAFETLPRYGGWISSML